MSSTLQVSFTLGYNSFSQRLVYRGNYGAVFKAMREFLEDKPAVVIMDILKRPDYDRIDGEP